MEGCFGKEFGKRMRIVLKREQNVQSLNKILYTDEGNSLNHIET